MPQHSTNYSNIIQMVAVMIGDVKLSMPGLQAIKREVKGQKKSKAASKKDNL